MLKIVKLYIFVLVLIFSIGCGEDQDVKSTSQLSAISDTAGITIEEPNSSKKIDTLPSLPKIFDNHPIKSLSQDVE